MQKLSETIYANLFWLISGLLVWLLILPLAIISLPVMLVKAVGQLFLNMPPQNQAQAQRNSQTNPERRSAKVVESLLTSLLMAILISVPALLSAIISLQPTRLIKGKQVLAQTLQPQPAKAQRKSSTDTIEVPAEEETSGT
jgi:lauroyl/myristoyl acyltransferase